LSHHWGVRNNVDVHRGLTRKRVVNFLLVLIEIFSLGVTVQALRAAIFDLFSLVAPQPSHLAKKFN